MRPTAYRPQLALAPPQWAVAPPPRPRGRKRRTAMLVAATCGLAAIAHAQGTEGGGGGGGGGAGGGGDTGAAAAPGGGGGGGATPGGGAAAAGGAAAPGSLRAQIESVLPGTNQPVAAPTTTPAWIITPGLSLQEQWTDNTFNTQVDRQSSLITVISPSLSINGATTRLTASLYYAPTVELYAPQSSQNQVGQNLGATALLTVMPDEFYVKANAFAGLVSTSGATAPGASLPGGTVALSKQNELQSYNFSIEPYMNHRFGGWGSVQVGVQASGTDYGAVGGGTTVQSLGSLQEFASATTGENFGRITDTLAASFTQNQGTGALQGAVNNQVSNQVGYAITRSVIVLASIGWEDIRYSGPDAASFTGATWSVGTQLTPNPDSNIVLSYGHQNGATAASVNASYAPTARVRLFAQYSNGIATAAQALNSLLAGATFDAFGHPISAQTGAPLAPSNNFFGFNGTIYKSENLSLSASWLLARDSFQLSLSQQKQTPVGNTGTLLAAEGNITLTQGLAATSGTTATLSWQHDLSPVLSSTASVQYGVLHDATPLTLSDGVLTATGEQLQNVPLFAVSAALNWQMTRTLTGTLQYSYTSSDYGNGLPAVSANLVVLGLNKTF